MGKNIEQARGRFKQAIGDLSGNKALKRRGKAEERAGNAKEAVDNVEAGIVEATDAVTDEITER